MDVSECSEEVEDDDEIDEHEEPVRAGLSPEFLGAQGLSLETSSTFVADLFSEWLIGFSERFEAMTLDAKSGEALILLENVGQIYERRGAVWLS